MQKVKNFIVRNISPAIRDKIVWFRDLWRDFPDTIFINNSTYKVLPDKFWISFNSGLWEPHLRKFYKNHVSSEKGVIDIGGFIGPSMFVACSHKPKRVTVAEADPDNFEILKHNCELNGLNKLVDLHMVCISNKSGEKVHFGPMDARLPHRATFGIGGVGREVETVSLREFIKGFDMKETNIIKIDIEGGERFLMDGLDYISEFPGVYVYLALHPPFWPEKEKTADSLLDVIGKFDVFNEMDHPLRLGELKEKMLSDEKTYHAGKKGVFFDIILKTK